MKRKRIKIVSKIRFTIFLSVFMIISLTIIGQGISQDNQKDLVHPSYIKVEVRKGDTLWSIAKYNDNRDKDIREKVYDIIKLNDMESARINPGDVIKVPYEY